MTPTFSTSAARLILVYVLSLPALARPAPVIDGRYCGTAWSGGELVEVITTLSTQPNGLLVGSYLFADNGEDTPGTLREYLKQNEDTRTMVWVDKYGTGQLTVRFDASRDSFTGKWGVEIDLPTYRWDGQRCSDDVASLQPL
jgi:hypothetical protein